jgi:hypothetical protein
MPRPLMQHGVGQLEEMFAKGRADPTVLKQLENELQYRQVPRAIALLSEVQAAIRGSSPAPPPATIPTAPTTRPLFPPVPQPEFVARPVSPPNPPTPATIKARPPSITPLPEEPPPQPSVAIPVDDAYKLLKATRSSTWESIEQTRREVVQQSHPDRVRLLTAERRSQVLSDAKRANDAYMVLSHARCAGH